MWIHRGEVSVAARAKFVYPTARGTSRPPRVDWPERQLLAVGMPQQAGFRVCLELEFALIDDENEKTSRADN